MKKKNILIISQFSDMGGAEEQLKILEARLGSDFNLYSYLTFNGGAVDKKLVGKAYKSLFNDFKLLGYILSLFQLIYTLIFILPKIDKIVVYRYRFIYWLPFIYPLCSEVILSIRVASERLKRLPLLHTICNLFVKTVVVNSPVTSSLLSSVGVECMTIANSVRNIDFCPPSKLNRRQLCYPARIHPSKNQKLAIEAIASRDDLELHFYGNVTDHNYYLDLCNLVRTLSLEDRVKFYPLKTPINKIFELYSIFLLASFEEGMSNLIMECLSNRKIILASNIPANDFLIKGRWPTYQPESNSCLLEAIIQIENQNNSFLEEKLDSIAVDFNKEFSEEKMIEKYIDLLS